MKLNRLGNIKSWISRKMENCCVIGWQWPISWSAELCSVTSHKGTKQHVRKKKFSIGYSRATRSPFQSWSLIYNHLDNPFNSSSSSIEQPPKLFFSFLKKRTSFLFREGSIFSFGPSSSFFLNTTKRVWNDRRKKYKQRRGKKKEEGKLVIIPEPVGGRGAGYTEPAAEPNIVRGKFSRTLIFFLL